MAKTFLILFFLLAHSLLLYSQKNIVTVGIQYKPILALDALNTGTESVAANGVTFTVGLDRGFCGGIVVRRGITDTYSLESGINYVNRVYFLKISDENFSGDSEFRIIGYEIPFSGLVYIKLSEILFMNASLGLSVNMFASDIYTEDSYFRNSSHRAYVFNPGIIGNLGWEYRTETAGYFYLGASYHNPFSAIFNSQLGYYENNLLKEKVTMPISGTYISLDLRYFFHEEPLKKQKKKEAD
ncbi:MAG TPA: hypothetical protein VI757_14875 [Bacteroidia bacterium]|nr:hypothetical protein [Bacteroidia bacterium]